MISTSYTPGTTFKSADLNELVYTVWNHSSLHSTVYAPITGSTYYKASSDGGSVGTSTSYYPFSTDLYSVTTHIHSSYAPVFSTSDYMPTFSTAGYAAAGHGHSSTGTYSTEGHVHAVATTSLPGFLITLSGASSKYLSSTGGWTDPPASTADGGSFGNMDGGTASAIYGGINPINGGSSA